MNTYYHNPKCTKSRLGLEKIKQSGLEIAVKEYLKDPLTVAELETICSKLGKKPHDIVRPKEKIYQELNLGTQSLSSMDWYLEIIKNPILLERPILVTHTGAAIGRPPENLDPLLSK